MSISAWRDLALATLYSGSSLNFSGDASRRRVFAGAPSGWSIAAGDEVLTRIDPDEVLSPSRRVSFT
jgi:hypothetical protein